MKFVVVDVQGFNTPKFYAKELAIYNGRDMKSYIFKPEIPYHILEDRCKEQVNYLYRNHHGIYYNYGEHNYEDIYSILHKDLQDVDRIYVKGHIKMDFLVDAFTQMKYKPPYIVNLESNLNVPKLEKRQTNCPYHTLDVCMCSIKNAYVLYSYVENFLPQ